MTTHMRPAPLPTLALAGIGSAALYGAAVLRFPLLAIYNHPLQNLDKLTGSAPLVGLALSTGVLLLFLGYALGALALLHTERIGTVARLTIIGLPFVFVALLVFVYPTTSLDVYDYLFRGRMAVHYHVNNFVAVPADFPTDPLMASSPFRFVPWSRAVTAYGPIWELVSHATAWLAGERPERTPVAIDPSLQHLMFGYKALGALGFVVCGAVLWGALGVIAPARRWFGLYLWLWNPLALWESVAAAHNDAWMAAAIVAACWSFALFVRPPAGQLRGAVGAFVALTVGGLIKYFALIFSPLMLTAALRRLPTWRARVQFVAISVTICALLVALAYAPFWVGMGTLRNFGDRGTLFYASWLAALQAGLHESGWLAKDVAQRAVASLATALLGLGVAWSAWRGWREPERVVAHATWLLLWFLLVANPWFQPWYLLWALALAALQPDRPRLVMAVIVFCATAMLSYSAGSFLLPALKWSGEGVAWNLLLSALIYGLPLLVLVVAQRQARSLQHALRVKCGKPTEIGTLR